MSGQPSLSKSPTATPEPLNRTRLEPPFHSSSTFVKKTPVCSGGNSVNPVLPSAGTFNSAHLKPFSECQAASPAKADRATRLPAETRTATISDRLGQNITATMVASFSHKE